MTTKTTYLMIGVLLLGSGLRLIGITNPLIGHHSWRQADTAAVARNFVEERFNILFPRVDWRGAASGEVECEFPIYQFAVACLFRLFGVNEAAGRLLSVIFSLAAIIGIYFLARRFAGRSVGLWAAFFLAILPMPVFFGRAVMPESLLLAACVYAVLLFADWHQSSSLRSLLLSALCLTVACLLKPHTLYLGLPLAYLAIHKYQRRAFLRPELWAYGIVLFASLALWYGHAHGIRQDTGLTFGVWEYGSDKWGNWQLALSWPFWEKILTNRIPYVLLSYLGLPLLIVGLCRPSLGDGEKVFSQWLLGTLVFVVIVAKGVYVHDYYLLPAAVPAAYFMGKAAAWGLGPGNHVTRWKRICIAICVIGTFGVSLSKYHKWLRKEDPAKSEAFQLAEAARRTLPSGSSVIAVDRGDPLILYYSHTKGWRSFPRDLSEEWVKAREGDGAEYILGVHEDFSKDGAERHLSRLLTRHEVLVDNGRFFVVATKRSAAGCPRGPPV